MIRTETVGGKQTIECVANLFLPVTIELRK